MLRKSILVILLALMAILSAGVLSAQGPTPTPPSSFGNFFSDSSATATPTTSGVGNTTTNLAQTPTPNPVTQTLTQNNYVVVTAGNWYDAQGKVAADSVYVMMLGVSSDPKSNDSVKQITSGFAALIAAYPNAANYHVLLLSGPFVYDASTTSKTLQLLNSQLLSPDAFLRDLLAQMRTISLVSGASTSATPLATATPAGAVATATRAPTRQPTPASSCNPPPGQARLYVKNGYSGMMRFTIGAPDVGFQKDFDIPADGQYHYIDLPPSGKYTYSASIPGVGKASAKLPAYAAGQCYYLTFQP
jgi:hypothetical protein